MRRMKLRHRMFIAVVAGLLTVGFFFYAFRARGPSYQGKELGAWLEEDYPQARYGMQNFRGLGPHYEETAEAIRAMGEKAIPPLLEMFESGDSAFKLMWVGLLEKQRLVEIPYTLSEVRRERALAGFRALGPRAKPALPELTRLFYRTNLASAAGAAIAAIGPEGLPVFGAGLTNEHSVIRRASAFYIGQLHSNALSEVSGLLACLNDTSREVRADAARSLGRIGRQAGLVVPALAQRLDDPDPWVRGSVLRAIGAFGPEAASAGPAITRAISNASPTEASFRKLGTNILKQIGATPGQ